MDQPRRHKQIEIPTDLLADSKYGTYGGDLRVGDLTGNGKPDFVVYRCTDGVKPCFIAAFDLNGKALWQHGNGGNQPVRPGPVAVYDVDGDGRDEVICFFHDPKVDAKPESLKDVLVQIRDGKTGEVKQSTHPAIFDKLSGDGANWVHQRILMANLSGGKRASACVIKLGRTVLAFDARLDVLWTYTNKWDEYGRCPAYIPAVGDIDGDGRDEVNGGYFLLDHDGTVLWQKQLAPNMDSVAVAPWDGGRMRAIGSGAGHVLDHTGKEVLKLGEQLVPHGQELRVGRFDADVPGQQMMIRYNGHEPDVMLVNVKGEVVRRFRLNASPNNTGMEAIWWHGADQPALLYNGGVLWRGTGKPFAELPNLPKAKGHFRQGWYHCVPLDLFADAGEDLLIYNPWDNRVFLYTRVANRNRPIRFRPSPRQYNARLMD